MHQDYSDFGGFGDDFFEERIYRGRDMLCLGGPKHGETMHFRGGWMTLSKMEPWPNDTEEFMGVLAGHPQPRSHGEYVPQEFVDGDGKTFHVLVWNGWKPEHHRYPPTP
jgi:hypothetical protein